MRVLNGSSRARAAEGCVNRRGSAGPPPDAGRTNSPILLPAGRAGRCAEGVGGDRHRHTGSRHPAQLCAVVCGFAAGCLVVRRDFFSVPCSILAYLLPLLCSPDFGTRGYCHASSHTVFSKGNACGLLT